MTKAVKDNNRVNTLIGVLNTDGETIKQAHASPTTHILNTMGAVGGSDYGNDEAGRDPNRVTTMLAASSSDGVTAVPLYIDLNNFLLIKST